MTLIDIAIIFSLIVLVATLIRLHMILNKLEDELEDEDKHKPA